MKKIIPCLIVMLLCVSFIMAGCGNSYNYPTFDAPSESTEVSSNGSLAVKKGAYVYFVGGFEKYSTASDGTYNKIGNVSTSAIYKAKLVDGEYTDVEVFVPKMAGFEYGSLYIFGEYLYFATPCQAKDSDGEVREDYITLARIKLDGSDYKEFYTPTTYSSSCSWSIVEIDGSVYGLVYNGTTITKIDVANKFKASVLASDVASVKFDLDGKSVVNETFSSYVYYTVAYTSKNGTQTSGNILYKKNIVSGDAIVVREGATDGLTATLSSCTNNKLIFTMDSLYYTYNGSEVVKLSNQKFSSVANIGSYGYVVKLGDNYCLLSGEGAYLTSADVLVNANPDTTVTTDNITLNILGVVGDYLYYTSATTNSSSVTTTALNKVLLTGEHTVSTVLASVGTLSTSALVRGDVVGNNVYYLASATSSTTVFAYYIDTTASTVTAIKACE